MSIRYLLIKVFYIFVILGQFPLLSAVLGSNFLYWGAERLLDLYYGRGPFKSSTLFPLNTLCDVTLDSFFFLLSQ